MKFTILRENIRNSSTFNILIRPTDFIEMVTQMKVVLPVIKCRHSLDIERNIFPHSRLKGKLLTKKKKGICAMILPSA